MALRSLRIERFRDIRSAEVTFERTTVLIGENDSGLADILAALASALAGPLEPGHLQLTFVESRAGSWGRPGLEALEPVIGRKATKPRTLVLDIDDGHWTLGTSRDDEAVLDAVRRINPLVRLRHGSLVHTNANESTEELLAEWVPERRRRGSMRAAVAEILERGNAAPAITPAKSGATQAQQLGVFAVAAHIVHELRRTSSPGVRPILLVEEPEAHLHPMTLASVWSLLEQFRSTQKIVTTNSGTLLAAAPLHSIRRIVRDPDGKVSARHVGRNGLRKEDLRKVGYHLRARRAVACFARVWLLVEGETEFWLMPDLARVAGYNFAQEGIACVEFAQCGLAPLITLANHLGIDWHVLTDGDHAGAVYAETVRPFVNNGAPHVTRLEELDIEHCFWQHGYAKVFERLANMRAKNGVRPTKVIRKAIAKRSKPGVAFELLAAAGQRGENGVPEPLRTAIETCVWLARGQTSTKERVS